MDSGEWKDLDKVVAEVNGVIADKKWTWAANSHCKYVSIRIDMRDGKAILLDRDGEPITKEQLQRQAFK